MRTGLVIPGLLLLASIALGPVADAGAELTVGGDPRVDPADFRVTVFASGLDFPNGLALLPDGSLLVAVSPPTGGSYFDSGGRLLRLTDADADGVADGPGTIVFDDPGAGTLTSLRVAGDLVFVTSAGPGVERISILRMSGGPTGPYTPQGTLDFAFPPGWEHKSYALAVRAAPGAPAGTWELYFNLGSSTNDAQSAETVGLSGLLTGTLQGASIYRVTVQDTGTGVVADRLTRIASGLRNAVGMDFHPATGDFYVADNGIDTPANRPEPLSADELNRIAAEDLGASVPDFGFPGDYVEYRTGQRVGSGGVPPLATFQPVPMPDGSESEGSAGLAFAPPGFPAGLANGIFVGFHGQSSLAGPANEENPVVFYDLATGEHFHFIENRQAGVGHPNTLLSTADSLFVADLSSTGGFASSGTGVIYQIRRRPPPARCPTCPDFDGDGQADILWRNTSGAVAAWLVNGTSVAGSGVAGAAGAEWTIVGVGDVDGDGRADLLWRNVFGTVAVWRMNGTAIAGTALLGTVATDWTIAGVGDFDGDGQADILWRNASGTVAIWLMNGAAVAGTALLGTVATDWGIVAVADFDGDGRADLLWRNTSGAVAIWLMTGTTVAGAGVLGTVATDWAVAGVGDFGGDSRADILWRSASGAVAIWRMDGLTVAGATTLATVGTDWTIAGVRDFGGDGRADILWRSTTGAVAVWRMNGAAVTGMDGLGAVSTDWRIQ